MKLDRNINPDGKGKYALINLRTNKVEWGDECPFFVIKYKDLYAVDALRGYAISIKHHIVSMGTLARVLRESGQAENAKKAESLEREIKDLTEWSEEILKEVEIAQFYPGKKKPD